MQFDLITTNKQPRRPLRDERDAKLIEIFDKACKYFKIPNALNEYMNHRIPAEIPNICLDTMNMLDIYSKDGRKQPTFYEWGKEHYEPFCGFFVRELITGLSGFSLVTETLTYSLSQFIKQYTKKEHPSVLEIGCGTGCLAKGLIDRGINVIATDSYDWFGGIFSYTNLWLPRNKIEELEMKDAVKKYGESVDFIICSWPISDCSIAEIPELMYNMNPNCKLIYCGEWSYGCTANDEFFENVESCQGYQYGIETVNRYYQTWDFVQDYWYLLEYSFQHRVSAKERNE